MEILIESRQTRIAIDQEDLRRKTGKILEGLACSPDGAISIIVVDADEMAELNFKYRGKPYATNVLAFSQIEGEGAPSDNRLLGDVAICADRAADDAIELGYTEDEMVTYLLIHGLLHLIGYLHDEPADAEAMQERVDLIFAEFYPAG